MFDVADVAYPVVSLGKVIESGFTFCFDDHKCHMHSGNKRVEIFRKGRIFVLRMRRRWKSTAHMVAPIHETADEEWESLMMEKEQEMQQWSPGRTNQGMIHHRHDHERFDQVRCDQEQKLCDNTI